MTGLAGKVAIVTGASRGLGRSVALRLGHLGATVVVNHRASADHAHQVVADIRAAGAEATAVACDVTDAADVDALFSRTLEQYGKVDVVVANAGLDFGLGPMTDIAVADFDRISATNARGAFLTLRGAARTIADDGVIVYIGSAATLTPTALFGLYAASKLPGNYWVGVLARELGPRGVRVNGVLPTGVDGAGYFAVDQDGGPLRAMLMNASPLGSRMGAPDDVADAVEYLTGPLSTWVSGHNLVVSGALV